MTGEGITKQHQQIVADLSAQHNSRVAIRDSCPRRLHNCLIQLGITYLDEVKGIPDSVLLRLRNFGKATLSELDKILIKNGLTRIEEKTERQAAQDNTAGPVAGKLDAPLSIAIVNNSLCITIGIERLAFCFKESEYNNPFDDELNDYKRVDHIADKIEFAKDVIRAMCDKAENGATPLTDFLDRMCIAAVEDGSLGVEDPDEHPCVPQA
jgi:hypothetical protein